MLRSAVEEGVVRRFHANACVESRHLALPLERYGELADFTESNNVFIDVGVELGARAVTDALKAVGLTPEDVDLIVSATVTGLAVPSLDGRQRRIATVAALRDRCPSTEGSIRTLHDSGGTPVECQAIP
jgi:alkylresorcinol/alkylpyrone synthase